jgi:hypothetical protein
MVQERESHRSPGGAKTSRSTSDAPAPPAGGTVVSVRTDTGDHAVSWRGAAPLPWLFFPAAAATKWGLGDPAGTWDLILRPLSCVGDVYRLAWDEWLGLAQRSVRGNIEAFSTLSSCRTPQDVVLCETDAVKDRLDDLLGCTARLSEKASEAFCAVFGAAAEAATRLPAAQRRDGN